MNKQEAIQKLNEIEKEQAKLRAIIEAPESNQWKPRECERFYSINLSGKAYSTKYMDVSLQDERIEPGNCFKTQEEAENSLKCTIMSSEYDYWIPGVSKCKPSFEPKGLQYFGRMENCWRTAGIPNPRKWHNDIYRWKRSEQ